MTDMSTNKRKLINIIRKKALIRGRKIVLASGKTSSYYIDVRKVSLSSQGLPIISELFLEFIRKNKITSVGGPTIGADPIVAGILFLSARKKYPLSGFLVRKKQKAHGTRADIEGHKPSKKDRILLIDDVATTGGSLLYSIDVLSNYRIRPLFCGCVVDRLSGARDNIEKKGVKFFALVSSEDILK